MDEGGEKKKTIAAGLHTMIMEVSTNGDVTRVQTRACGGTVLWEKGE